MTTLETNSVLKLNSGYMPIDIIDTFEAIVLVFNERARFVDPETYATYNFEDWVDNWDDAITEAHVAASKVISTPSLHFLIPEVIICNDYEGLGYSRKKNLKPKFSRRNVFARDKDTCQYCGKKGGYDEMNIDHITPRSKGGKTEWLNVVLSCIPCNDKKSNKTLKQAGLKLKRQPFVPTVEDLKRPFSTRLMRKLKGDIPKNWESFLGKMYWNVELKD